MIHDLAAYEAFIAVATRGSLTSAARALDRSIQAVSRDLARLETDLGVQLIARSTRRSRLTEAGQAFVLRVQPLLAELEAAREEARGHAAVVAGILRVAAPSLFGPQVLMPYIAEFIARHPRLSVRLDLDDSFVDPVASGADVLVRIGDSLDSGAVARRIGQVRQVLIAAPSYLARHGRPKTPADLGTHHCVIRHDVADARRWTLGRRGHATVVEVRGTFETDSAAASNRAAELGLGIGRAALWQVKDAVGQGRLEIVLADFEPEPRPVRAIRASRSPMPARARLFIDLLAQRLSTQAL